MTPAISQPRLSRILCYLDLKRLSLGSSAYVAQVFTDFYLELPLSRVVFRFPCVFEMAGALAQYCAQYFAQYSLASNSYWG